MELNQSILDRDTEMNKVLVVQSPNFPTAGQGLISNHTRSITEGWSLPYWGKVYLHFFQGRSIDDIQLEEKMSVRLIVLPVQPF